MIRVWQALVLAAATCGSAGAAMTAVQTPMIRPGEYEITETIEHGKTKNPPTKSSDCLSAETLTDFTKTILGPDSADDCKISKVVSSERRYSFQGACEDYSYTVEMTFTGDSFSTLLVSKDFEGGGLIVKQSGRRTGECKGKPQ